MSVIFLQIVILFAFALIGFSMCKAGIISSDSSKFLSTLVVWVFMPATTFKSFSTNFTVKYITEKYDIKFIQPVDMFPGTTHVETVCLLTHS